MSRLTIEVTDDLITNVAVDGKPVVLLRRIELVADADEGVQLRATFPRSPFSKEYKKLLLRLPFAKAEEVGGL